MKIAYRKDRFREKTLHQIDNINEILNELASEGYRITLRQLYYQLVATMVIPNTVSEYNKLKYLVNKARWNGLISWTAIEDRNRTRHLPYVQTDVNDALSGVSGEYSLDWWRDQDHYLEIWVEKDALGNVIERPANRWMLPHFACKGYVSASELFNAANKFKSIYRETKRVSTILHLGDHDPSGIDMTRDMQDRLQEMGAPITVRRIALTMDQIKQHKLPPNPAKQTDARFADYEKLYGSESWELDALKPKVIDALIETVVREYVDLAAFEAVQAEEAHNKKPLEWLEMNVDSVLDFARSNMTEGEE